MAELIKTMRPHCEWHLFERGTQCKRQGNFTITFENAANLTTVAAVCYRHRWRALDRALEVERHNNEGAR